MAKQPKRKQPLWSFFAELKQLEEDDYLMRLSENKLDKLHALLNKHIKSYNSIFYSHINAQITRDLRKSYKWYSLTGFKRNNKGLRGWRLYKLKDQLRKAMRERITNSLLLIKTQNSSRMQTLHSRFLNWLLSPQETRESLRSAMQVGELVSKKDKHFKMILADQTRKMISNFDNIVAEEYKAIGFYWKTRRDDRVVGKPGGKNPKGNKKHEDHYHRQDKFYFFHNNWAVEKRLVDTKHKDFAWADFEDGMPGQPINCRCYAYNVYELEDIPPQLLTEKGKRNLDSA